MASGKLTVKSIAIGIVSGAILGFIGLLAMFTSFEVYPGPASPIVYAMVMSAIFIAAHFIGKTRIVPAAVWVAYLVYGIIFPLSIPLSFISIGKLQGYTSQNYGSSTGGTNGGNYSSSNYSDESSGVVPRSGSRFGGGRSSASETQSEPAIDAFGQSKSSEPTGGPRFGRTVNNDPTPVSEERSLHDRIADLDNDETITITLTDGRLFSFNTIAVIPLDDEVYCVVEAAEALEDIPVGMMGVFKFIWGEGGEEMIASVDDQATLDRVEVEFQKLLDAQGSN